MSVTRIMCKKAKHEVHSVIVGELSVQGLTFCATAYTLCQ